MAFNPAEFDLEPNLSDENMSKAVSALRTVVENLKKATDSGESVSVKKAREELATVTLPESFLENIRSDVHSLSVEAPQSTVTLYNFLSELRDSVKVHRDLAISEQVKKMSNGTEEEDTEENTGSKSDAEGLRDFIQSLFNARQAMGLGVPENFPVKVSEKTGETLPDLPRIPSGPREEGVIVGRNAKTRKLQLSWQANGEEAPVKLTDDLGTVAVRVCSSAYTTYTAADILSRVRAQVVDGEQVDPFSGKEWKLELAHGTLHGVLPS